MEKLIYMEKSMQTKEFLATICSLHGHVMANMRLNCKIVAKLENRKFEDVLKEASAEAVKLTEGVFATLPWSNEEEKRN